MIPSAPLTSASLARERSASAARARLLESQESGVVRVCPVPLWSAEASATLRRRRTAHCECDGSRGAFNFELRCSRMIFLRKNNFRAKSDKSRESARRVVTKILSHEKALACHEKAGTQTHAALPWVRAENQRSPELLSYSILVLLAGDSSVTRTHSSSSDCYSYSLE